VTVELAGLSAASTVLVDFTMAGMDMGQNRYRLAPGEAGRWQGQATLPVCTSGRMDWLARVEVLGADDGTVSADFPFVIEN